MSELFQTLVQIGFGLGLLYGLIMMVRHWSETIPMGGSADEFANHQR